MRYLCTLRERKIQDLDYEEIIFCTIFPLVYVSISKISLWSKEPTCVEERAEALGRGDCWSCCQPRWKTNCEEDTLPVEYCLRSRFSWQYTIHHSASMERFKFREKLQAYKAVGEISRSFSLYLEKVLISLYWKIYIKTLLQTNTPYLLKLTGNYKHLCQKTPDGVGFGQGALSKCCLKPWNFDATFTNLRAGLLRPLVLLLDDLLVGHQEQSAEEGPLGAGLGGRGGYMGRLVRGG